MPARCSAIRRSEGLCYPKHAPFDPSARYPEMNGALGEEENPVYEQFRSCLIDLEMDKAHLGTADWNPFSDFIEPDNTVVIKPNFVLNTARPEIQNCCTTHPSLIRAVIDYAWLALKGRGRIIVGDACASEANFDEIVERTGTRDMIGRLRERGVAVELRDFRAVKVLSENGIWTGEQADAETEAGKIVNLGASSLFCAERFRHAKLHGAGYDIAATNRCHHDEVQEYRVSRTILEADVVISMPKVKTHRKAGFTGCLKNLVGINVDKNYLPHFTMGPANSGGDEMPAVRPVNAAMLACYNFLREHVIAHTWRIIGGPAAGLLRALSGSGRKQDSPDTAAEPQEGAAAEANDRDMAGWLHSKLSGQQVAAGAWAGNETICCMILDLNRIFLCCGRDGSLMQRTDRKVFYVADAIEVGMGNGPTSPIPLPLGAVGAGYNGLALDTQFLNLFGIDEKSIPLYDKAGGLDYMHLGEDGVRVYNGERWQRERDRFGSTLVPPDNWEYRSL